MSLQLFVRVKPDIFFSTLAKNRPARHMFEDLMKVANEDGIVTMGRDAFFRLANYSAEEGNPLLDFLEAPDPESRSAAEEGRRIVRLAADRDIGWRLVNWEIHNGELTRVAERRRIRDAMRRLRSAKTGKVSPQSPLPDETRPDKRSVTCDDSTVTDTPLGSKTEEVPDVELPKRFPRTETEAVAAAATAGCPPEFAAVTYHHAVGRGGRDARDVPIRNWVGHLRAAWVFQQNREAKEKHNAKHTASSPQRVNRNLGTANAEVDPTEYDRAEARQAEARRLRG